MNHRASIPAHTTHPNPPSYSLHETSLRSGAMMAPTLPSESILIVQGMVSVWHRIDQADPIILPNRFVLIILQVHNDAHDSPNFRSTPSAEDDVARRKHARPHVDGRRPSVGDRVSTGGWKFVHDCVGSQSRCGTLCVVTLRREGWVSCTQGSRHYDRQNSSTLASSAVCRALIQTFEGMAMLVAARECTRSQLRGILSLKFP